MRLSGVQSTRLSHHVPRRFRSLPTQDADIVPNSLRKTLEAHRSSNRNRLIRRIYPRSPAAGLFRPWIPPENRAGYIPPEPPISTPEVPDRIPKTPAAKTRARRRTPAHPPHAPQKDNCINAIRNAGPDAPEQQRWADFLPKAHVIGDASTYLDAEIQALHHYLTPSPREQRQITQLITDVKSLLEPVAPHTPRIIGSHYTGLALAHSDLNFLLPFEDLPRTRNTPRGPSATRPQIQDTHVAILRKAESALQRNPVFSNQVNWDRKGKPILEARHRPTGLLLRFHCGETVPALEEYLRDASVEFPALRPLYTGTRTLLESRGLFGSTHANIRSEALAILVLAFLKTDHVRFPGPRHLGDQFLELLKFYGVDTDLQSVGVAVDPLSFFDTDVLRSFTKKEQAKPSYLRGQKSLINAKRTAAMKGNLPVHRRLCVQDPTQYMNDLGRSCTRTPELQSALKMAYEQLSRASDIWNARAGQASILTAALRANFDELEKIRGQIISPEAQPSKP